MNWGDWWVTIQDWIGIAIVTFPLIVLVLNYFVDKKKLGNTGERGDLTAQHDRLSEQIGKQIGNTHECGSLTAQIGNTRGNLAKQIGDTGTNGSLTAQNLRIHALVEKLEARNVAADFSGAGDALRQIQAMAEEHGRVKTELERLRLELLDTRRALEKETARANTLEREAKRHERTNQSYRPHDDMDV